MGAIAPHPHHTMNLEARILIHAIAGLIGYLGLHCLVQWALGAELTIYGYLASAFALVLAITLIIRGDREQIIGVGLVAVGFTLGMAIALVSWQ